MARILLGVSGGIAAYKALEFVRLASAAEHSLRVVQTPTSTRFVGEASFAALTGAPVLLDEFEHDPARGAFPGGEQPSHQPLSHLQLVANADLYLIAPASANTLAKLAAGIADNLLTSCALAASCPVVVAPAMNNHMFEHPATQANIELLRTRGVQVIEPGSGRLASRGEHGVGRLAEPERLLAACEGVLADGEVTVRGAHRSAIDGIADRPARGGPWGGLRVLVTAGGTREPIDSVRFLGNSSSGRMGLALAEAARQRGAKVTLVAANVTLAAPSGVRMERVGTAAELQEACEREFPDCDVLLMAAAVADFRPSSRVDGKIKKGGRDRLTLELEPTADIICGLARQRRADQTLVAFAAEHGSGGIEQARSKLTAKCVDAVVFNDISREDIGFESELNEVTIVSKQEDHPLPRASKRDIAEGILDTIELLRGRT
ncbi:MAG: bifunctional phosphopantothenoylcysteine decarboxylase/phosphopantothenate--cysteine ligase CoaBC [Solirubrobacteraceae bacterium]